MTRDRVRPDRLPLAARVKFGAGRGAVIGAIVFALQWLGLTRGRDIVEHVRREPVIAAGALIAGFAVAGGILLAVGRDVRTLSGAIGLGIACFVPVLGGFVLAATDVRGLDSLAFVCLGSSVAGTITGVLTWKGWFKGTR